MPRVFLPFRFARRWLKRINYYSASKGRSPWKRSADWWLILSLPVAIAITIAVNDIVKQSTADLLIRIRLGQDSTVAPMRGWVERERDEPWAIGIPLGTATVFATQETFGWPLATTETHGPTTVKYTDFNSNCTIMESPLPEQSRDLTNAIAMALDQERMEPIAAAWIDGTTRTSTYALTFLAQGAIYWVTLFVLGLLLLQALRLVVGGIRHQRRRLIVRRLGRGLCPGCRYDLSGSKFPEYCPECGQRIWG